MLFCLEKGVFGENPRTGAIIVRHHHQALISLAKPPGYTRQITHGVDDAHPPAFHSSSDDWWCSSAVT